MALSRSTIWLVMIIGAGLTFCSMWLSHDPDAPLGIGSLLCACWMAWHSDRTHGVLVVLWRVVCYFAILAFLLFLIWGVLFGLRWRRGYSHPASSPSTQGAESVKQDGSAEVPGS